MELLEQEISKIEESIDEYRYCSCLNDTPLHILAIRERSFIL